MSTSADELQPLFSHAEPVLSVTDVTETIRYWQDVLGFPNHWLWGEPPHDHGGVSWHGAHFQFHKDPERAKKGVGTYVWMRLRNIDTLYKMHQERKVEIVYNLQQQPWGLAEYTVKDINGYNLVFAGNSAVREKSGEFPDHVTIVERKPTPDEFQALRKSVGWYNAELLDDHLLIPVYGVVAVDTDTSETIGCALIMSDNASFYYVKDVIVKKEWQKKRVGTALMKAVSAWIDKNGVSRSLVGLYTGEGLEDFYQLFGFGKAFGMVKHVP